MQVTILPLIFNQKVHPSTPAAWGIPIDSQQPEQQQWHFGGHETFTVKFSLITLPLLPLQWSESCSWHLACAGTATEPENCPNTWDPTLLSWAFTGKRPDRLVPSKWINSCNTSAPRWNKRGCDHFTTYPQHHIAALGRVEIQDTPVDCQEHMVLKMYGRPNCPVLCCFLAVGCRQLVKKGSRCVPGCSCKTARWFSRMSLSRSWRTKHRLVCGPDDENGLSKAVLK